MTDKEPRGEESASPESEARSTLTLVQNMQRRMLVVEERSRRVRASDTRSRRSALMTLTLVAVILVPFVCLWVVFAGLVDGPLDDRQCFFLLCREDSTRNARREAFLTLAAKGHNEWRSARLDLLDLRGVDLGGAKLRRANFRGTDLSEARLVRTSFAHAVLQTANLLNVNAEGADFRGADFGRNAVLSGANLKGANLEGANLAAVEASGVQLIEARLRKADLNLANLVDANLEKADLRKANLYVARLKGANLRGARLKGARLEKADLTDTNWWRAKGIKKEVVRLMQEFEPGAEAPPALREDYEVWLKKKRGEL